MGILLGAPRRSGAAAAPGRAPGPRTRCNRAVGAVVEIQACLEIHAILPSSVIREHCIVHSFPTVADIQDIQEI